MNWPTVKLGEVMTVGRGSSPRPIKDERFFTGGTIPWVKIADATASGKFIYQTNQHVNDYGASFSRKLKPGALIFPASGTLGIPRFLGVEACIHDGWLYFSDYQGIDPDWLYYRIILLKDYYEGIAYGAAIQNINTDIVRNTEIQLPDLATQRAMTAVLSAYDDLIATNQGRIALLEDAARRLYREWFVHLRFPGHESVPVKDGVPEGWRKTPMTSVADFVNGFAFKPEHLGESGLPVVKIPELRSGITSKTPFNPGHIVPQRNHITTGDVLFSWSATLLVNEWGEGPALLNQHLFKVIPHNELHKRLVRFAVEAAIPELTGHAVGATMQHIRRSALDNHLMLVPDDTTATAFAGQADPMMDAVLNLTAQNRELTKARDLLLPKLMSGQLDVSGIALPDEVAA